MDLKRTFSLVDISERLKKPRTTLAEWARQFNEFLPTVGTGRTMRYEEEALEVFGLISKMKEINQPPEYIREQLRAFGLTPVITVATTHSDDSNGKPYLMQIGDEVEDLKKTVRLLIQKLDSMTTANYELKQQISNGIQEQLVTKDHLISSLEEQRAQRLTERLTERKIERQLEKEASLEWGKLPSSMRLKKTGVFRKEENSTFREEFIRDYINDHLEERLRKEYEI